MCMCTIAAKNYLSFARTLVDSFLEHWPGGKAYVLLSDEPEGLIDTTHERFELLTLETIGTPDRTTMAFRYGVVELSTAVKPLLLQYLFDVKKESKAVYLDPDILITGELTELDRLLDSWSIVLTPHLLAPLPDDGKRIGELDLLLRGAYNLGFIGLAGDEATKSFLEWWKERLFKYGYDAVEQGMFVDQKWIDLVPGMFDKTYILRDPAYNAAWWNLHERPVSLREGRFFAGEKPLVFYHFSGIEMGADLISRHQNRIDWHHMPQLRELYGLYKTKVLQNGCRASENGKYAFGFFDNGVKVPAAARNIYRSLGHSAGRFGNPFRSGKNSFYLWLMQPVKRGNVPRIAWEAYKLSPSVMARYPNPLGKDGKRFLRWVKRFMRKQLGDEGWTGRIRKRKNRKETRRRRNKVKPRRAGHKRSRAA